MWQLKIIFLVSFLFAFIPPSFALNCHNLKGSGDDHTTYKLRQNDLRCEGFYQSNVGSPSLQLVNLTLGELNYDLANTSSLNISIPVKEPFKLRGLGIPLKLYYRLDANIAVGKTFKLPLDVLQREKVPAQHVGFFGELEGRRYVPLSINNSNKPVHITLRSSIDVSTVQWRMATVAAENCQNWSQWHELTTQRRFRAGRPITFTLPNSQTAQVCVEVAALPNRGGDWLKQLLRIQLR